MYTQEVDMGEKGAIGTRRVTLYVKDAAAGIWERAKKVTEEDDESLSGFVTDAVLTAVERREREREATKARGAAIEEIELKGVDYHKDEMVRRLRFRGVLVLENPGAKASFYVTAGKKVVVEHWSPIPNGQPALELFDSYQEFLDESERFDAEAINAVADAVGEEYLEEIE